MNEMTYSDLLGVSGGDNALMVWGEQAAADGLAAMDSSNPIKSVFGTILASAGGWAYMSGWLFDSI